MVVLEHEVRRGGPWVVRRPPVTEAVSLPFVAQMVSDGRFLPNDAAPGGAKAMLDELIRTSEALSVLRG